jgi:hypothetical protein
MPNFDKTGPKGQGAMSGRKMGKCTNYGAGKNQQINNDNTDQQNQQGQGFFRRMFAFGGERRKNRRNNF